MLGAFLNINSVISVFVWGNYKVRIGILDNNGHIVPNFGIYATNDVNK